MPSTMSATAFLINPEASSSLTGFLKLTWIACPWLCQFPYHHRDAMIFLVPSTHCSFSIPGFLIWQPPPGAIAFQKLRSRPSCVPTQARSKAFTICLSSLQFLSYQFFLTSFHSYSVRPTQSHCVQGTLPSTCKCCLQQPVIL